MTNFIAVRTVGLRSYQQAQLKAHLAPYAQITLEQVDDWNFGVLNADVLVVGVDTRGGQETLDMLRSFTGGKQPRVVTYSENDERMRLLAGRPHDAGEAARGRRSASFYERLQDTLRKAGATGVALEDISAPAVTAPKVEGPAAQGGVRWTD